MFRRDRKKHGGGLCFTSMKMFLAKQLLLKASPMTVKSL